MDIIDYSDAKEKVNEAKYLYCSSTKNSPTPTTKTYIADLIKINYKDSKSMLKTINAWKAEVSVDVTLVLGSQTGVGFYAKLSGGDGSGTKVKFVTTVDGETSSYCDDKLYFAGDTAECGMSSMFFDLTKEYYVIKVYDGKGNLIGSFSGKPKDPFND